MGLLGEQSFAVIAPTQGKAHRGPPTYIRIFIRERSDKRRLGPRIPEPAQPTDGQGPYLCVAVCHRCAEIVEVP